MTAYFGKIDAYFINIFSDKSDGAERHMNLNGTFGKAILWFMPQGRPLPENRKRSGQNLFDVYYRITDWEAILDVLRNETPVYFNYQDTNNTAQIYTGDEPVGEGET